MSSSFSKAAYRAPRPPRADTALVGSTIAGKYRLVRTLGYGGMGAVYKAENLAIGKVVAIKLLHRSLTDDAVAMQRFRREARATVAIAHPNIVEVLDMGQDASGSPFLVMEYVRGASLKSVLRADGPMPVARAARVAGQIADALAAAHHRGVIHRDLKPENILLSDRQGVRDVVTVVDFGISTFIDAMAEHEREVDLTPTGLTMATPFYASPEQIRGAKGRDPRVDIYAVGVMLYEMLAGHRPFEADNLPDLCMQILEGEVAPLAAFRKDVPPAFEQVVRRALEKRPSARTQSARELVRSLGPFGGPAPHVVDPDPTDSFTVDVSQLPLPASASEEREREPSRPEGTSLAARPVHPELARALLDAFTQRFGAGPVQEVLARLDPGTRQRLADDACEGTSLATALAALDRTLGRGDRAEIAQAGRFFAQQALDQRGGVPRSTTPELFFSLSADLYQHYVGFGEARVSSVGRGYGRLEIRCAVRPPLALVIVMLGVLDEGLRRAGAGSVSVRLVKASALGDPLDMFEASWG